VVHRVLRGEQIDDQAAAGHDCRSGRFLPELCRLSYRPNVKTGLRPGGLHVCDNRTVVRVRLRAVVRVRYTSFAGSSRQIYENSRVSG
jgi:hypothetical protein